MKIKYGESESNVGEIVRGVLIQQTFQPEHSFLKSISIDFGTYCKQIKSSIIVEIIRGNQCIKSIRQSAKKIEDNVFFKFDFDVELHPSLPYDLRIYSDDAIYGNAVTVKYGKPINNFWVFINGVKTRGQIHCIFEYDGRTKCDNSIKLTNRKKYGSNEDFCSKVYNPKRKTDLSIIIPTAVRGDHLVNCLDSIYSNTIKDFEVIVIANSTELDFHQEVLNEIFNYSNFKLLCIPKMAGYVSSCNLGASISKGDYLCILNDDTIVGNNWANDIIEEFERDNNLAQVGPKITYCDAGFNHSEEVGEIAYIEGWCFLIPRRIYEDYGLFDEKLKFAYCEDSDFSHMLQMKGFDIKEAGKVFHIGVQTRTSNRDLELYLEQCELYNKRYLKKKWKFYE